MTRSSSTVLLLGKLPPPYMGPSVATQILLGSALRTRYRLLHVDTNVHRALRTLGTWSLGKVGRNLGIYRRFAAVLLRERPELVLVPISQTTLGFAKDAVFILLARAAGCRVLVQLRGSALQAWLRQAGRGVRAAVEFVLRRAHGSIVLGENLRPLFAPYHSPDRVFVVPNGADYVFPEPTPRHPFPVRLLYLANLMRAKGIEDVLLAVHRMREACAVPFHLDVVGAWLDDETEARCRELMARYRPPVTFHPPASGAAKLRFLADADVFVFPPRGPEGHPWVLVEALAAGLPVVATDRGAIASTVVDGVNGFIVPGASPDRLAGRLRQLVEEAGLRREMGAAGRAHYEHHFTEAHMVDRLAAAIDAVLGREHAPGPPALSRPSAPSPAP